MPHCSTIGKILIFFRFGMLNASQWTWFVEMGLRRLIDKHGATYFCLCVMHGSEQSPEQPYPPSSSSAAGLMCDVHKKKSLWGARRMGQWEFDWLILEFWRIHTWAGCLIFHRYTVGKCTFSHKDDCDIWVLDVMHGDMWRLQISYACMELSSLILSAEITGIRCFLKTNCRYMSARMLRFILNVSMLSLWI